MSKISLSRILYPTDFSENAAHALPYAVGLAEDHQAELCILHVIEDILTPAYFGAHFDPSVIPSAELEASAQKELSAVLPDADAQPFPVRTILRRGSPYAEILETVKSEEADVIVMATRGYSGLAHLLLGSTAERIVRASPVPVLTIRHPHRNK